MIRRKRHFPLFTQLSECSPLTALEHNVYFVNLSFFFFFQVSSEKYILVFKKRKKKERKEKKKREKNSLARLLEFGHSLAQ